MTYLFDRIKRSWLFFFFTLFLLFSSTIGITQKLSRFRKPKVKIDTIYYPFYSDIQMIQVKHTYLDRSYRRRVTFGCGPQRPIIAFSGNKTEFFFRNTEGIITKAYDTKHSIKDLNNYFAAIPKSKVSKDVNGKVRLHSDLKNIYTNSISSMSTEPRYFSGYYLVNSYQAKDSLQSIEFERGSVGIIDSLGNLKIPIQHHEIWIIGKKVLIRQGELSGLRNIHNETLIPIEYKDGRDKNNYNDFIGFYKNGVIQKVYVPLTDSIYAIDDFTHISYVYSGSDVRSFWKNGKIGFVNTNFQIVNSPQYDYIDYDFHSERLMVYRDGKFGYLNFQGEEVIPCQYEHALPFLNDTAEVEWNDEIIQIDKYGKKIRSGEYRKKREKRSTLHGTNYILVLRYGVWGLENAAGERILPSIYKGIMPIYEEGLPNGYYQDRVKVRTQTLEYIILHLSEDKTPDTLKH